jgi:COMPASS component SWD1
LAPDFVEVEENVEYDEPEDVFDIHPIEEIQKRRLDQEDEPVDVLTIESRKDDFEEGAFHMPVFLDMDGSESEEEIVAVGPGTMRRKSPGEGMEWMNGTEANESLEERPTRRTANGTTAKTAKTRKR